MTDEQLELVHREIDGETTAEESRRLRELLAEDEELRRCHDELASLADRLDRVEPVAPPPDLRTEIIRSIRRSAGEEPQRPPAGGLRRWLDRLRPGHGYAFAAGLAAGVILLAVFSSDRMPGFDESLVSGSLLRPASDNSAEILGRVQLDLEGARSVVVARRGAGIVWLDVDVVSQDVVEVQLVAGGTSWNPLGFEQSRPGGDVTMQPDRFSVRHRGENHYRIAFEELDSPVRVTLRTSLEASIERTLSVARSTTHPGP